MYNGNDLMLQADGGVQCLLEYISDIIYDPTVYFCKYIYPPFSFPYIFIYSHFSYLQYCYSTYKLTIYIQTQFSVYHWQNYNRWSDLMRFCAASFVESRYINHTSGDNANVHAYGINSHFTHCVFTRKTDLNLSVSDSLPCK